MKELSQRAGVSVATLYRYFPAKDHVLLAILLSRYSAALTRVTARGPARRDRPRAGDQPPAARVPRRAARAAADGGAEPGHQRDQPQLQRDHRAGRAACTCRCSSTWRAAGAPISAEQRQLLPVVQAIFGAATRRWLAGVSSPAQARFEIRVGCRLLDLPDAACRRGRSLLRRLGELTSDRSRIERRHRDATARCGRRGALDDDRGAVRGARRPAGAGVRRDRRRRARALGRLRRALAGGPVPDAGHGVPDRVDDQELHRDGRPAAARATARCGWTILRVDYVPELRGAASCRRRTARRSPSGSC